MNDEELLAQRRPDEALLLSASPLPETFDVPVFFEPLDAEAIARANEDAWLVGVVLDGDGPLGREWIMKIRQLCHMVADNTMHFGASPYYCGFRDWRTGPRPSRNSDASGEQDRRRALQYLMYVQGSPDPASRRRIAMAMLRQWQAESMPSHNLDSIKPKYFEQAPGLLRPPGQGQNVPALSTRTDHGG